jgi:hypothetical protein
MKKSAATMPLPFPFSPYAVFFDALARIYEEMDRQYNTTAVRYGFVCNGCADNCCLTRFYHHTHIEHLYLVREFFRLDSRERIAILQQAEAVEERAREEGGGSPPLRAMCPLNIDERCRLYEYRPMICRLHGIPHEFRAPGRDPAYGPGCAEFVRKCGARSDVRFDRTPFYARLAELELRFKRAAGLHEKFKKTVAGMIVAAGVGAAGKYSDETP